MRVKLFQDSVVALKSGDSKKSQALRFLVSLIDKEAFRKLVDNLSEEEELKVLQKELKNKQESLAAFSSAGRSELVSEVEVEIAMLEEYLPKALTDSDLEAIVNKHVAVEKNFGALMKLVSTEVAGRADGGRIAAIVKCKI